MNGLRMEFGWGSFGKCCNVLLLLALVEAHVQKIEFAYVPLIDWVCAVEG